MRDIGTSGDGDGIGRRHVRLVVVVLVDGLEAIGGEGNVDRSCRQAVEGVPPGIVSAGSEAERPDPGGAWVGYAPGSATQPEIGVPVLSVMVPEMEPPCVNAALIAGVFDPTETLTGSGVASTDLAL